MTRLKCILEMHVKNHGSILRGSLCKIYLFLCIVGAVFLSLSLGKGFKIYIYLMCEIYIDLCLHMEFVAFLRIDIVI